MCDFATHLPAPPSVTASQATSPVRGDSLVGVATGIRCTAKKISGLNRTRYQAALTHGNLHGRLPVVRPGMERLGGPPSRRPQAASRGGEGGGKNRLPRPPPLRGARALRRPHRPPIYQSRRFRERRGTPLIRFRAPVSSEPTWGRREWEFQNQTDLSSHPGSTVRNRSQES